MKNNKKLQFLLIILVIGLISLVASEVWTLTVPYKHFTTRAMYKRESVLSNICLFATTALCISDLLLIKEIIKKRLPAVSDSEIDDNIIDNESEDNASEE
ncbi:MAG: hypothetical protein K6G26_11005 [Lachnospiraceae bacterium]|nr:hypothetical protein [Lachnospiraceae bacterium]